MTIVTATLTDTKWKPGPPLVGRKIDWAQAGAEFAKIAEVLGLELEEVRRSSGARSFGHAPRHVGLAGEAGVCLLMDGEDAVTLIDWDPTAYPYLASVLGDE
jgi:hypothetical protein